MNVFFNSVETWDFSVLDFIQAHMRCPFLDFIMPYITHLGAGGILWIILTVIFLLPRKYRKAGINCAAALLLSLIVVNFAVKPLAARIRPYDINPLIQLLIDAPNDFSCGSINAYAEKAFTRRSHACRSCSYRIFEAVPVCAFSDGRYLRSTARSLLCGRRLLYFKGCDAKIFTIMPRTKKAYHIRFGYDMLFICLFIFPLAVSAVQL